MGGWGSIAAAISQLFYCFMLMVSFTIGSGTAMRRIAQLACEYEGKETESCWGAANNDIWKLVLIFGGTSVIPSLFPSMESLNVTMLFSVATSLGYCFIGIGLGMHYAGNREGTAHGAYTSPADKAFGTLNALGTLALTMTISAVLPEIQDTLRQPPKASKSMKTACHIAIALTFVLYMLISIGGYAALGEETPSFILTGFPNAPKWLMIIANLLVLLHLIFAYQVFAQPCFDSIETLYLSIRGRQARWGKSATPVATKESLTLEAGDNASDDDGVFEAKGSLNDEDAQEASTAFGEDGAHARGRNGLEIGPSQDASRAPYEGASESAPEVRVADPTHGSLVHGLERVSTVPHVLLPATHPPPPPLHIWERLPLRVLVVGAATIIACCLPFFSDMAGLIGALTFWPLSVFFPIECYRIVYKPTRRFLFFYEAVNVIMLLVSIAAVVGSIQTIIESSKTYKPFGRS